jgi:GAF domain-containing protein
MHPLRPDGGAVGDEPDPDPDGDAEVDYERLTEDLRRLHSISSDASTDLEGKVDRVLELGCDRLGVEVGFLSAIDRRFEVVAARGDHPDLQAGAEAPLSETYCRKTVESDEALAVGNAPEEGWDDDPAYDVYGLTCYIGAKVLVEGELYGTLCFADADRTRGFSAADRTLVDLMARGIGYEIERERHLEELREDNRRFEELAQALSHDMGNLLEVARGHVQYVLESGDTDRLHDAADAHDRAVTLLEHMVTLTRAGKRVDDPVPVDLATAAETAWTHVGGDGARLAATPEDVRLLADHERLVQLLENLFRNSVEHGRGTATVRVGALDDGFYVEDDGPGIPPAERERVFESGVSGADGGTGLGLSIVERVATAHGWSVRATEGDGGGARFEVTGVAAAGR